MNVAFASGLAAVNASPTSVKASVSDAAANTVMSPSTPGVVVVGASVVAAAVVAGASVAAAAAVVSAEPPSSSLPHAAAPRASTAIGTSSRRDVLVIGGTVVRFSRLLQRN